jgi:Tfp pilus assembly protein PilN
MDATGMAALIVAITGAIGTAIGGLMAAWKWAKAQAKAEFLKEQSASTIRELEASNADLEAENKRLWSLLSERS